LDSDDDLGSSCDGSDGSDSNLLFSRNIFASAGGLFSKNVELTADQAPE
jgi:hypothetical protein